MITDSAVSYLPVGVCTCLGASRLLALSPRSPLSSLSGLEERAPLLAPRLSSAHQSVAGSVSIEHMPFIAFKLTYHIRYNIFPLIPDNYLILPYAKNCKFYCNVCYRITFLLILMRNLYKRLREERRECMHTGEARGWHSVELCSARGTRGAARLGAAPVFCVTHNSP